LLPADLLSLSRGGARSTPRYLAARDEVWVRSLLDQLDAFVGRTAAERDAELPRIARALAREHGVGARAARGVVHVAARGYAAEVVAPAPPGHLRRVVFEEAARTQPFDRRDALERGAARLGLDPAAVEASLFADRAAARRIQASESPPSAASTVDAYNLSLVQGLLARSERVVVELREHVRAVVRFAKLGGLLCTCSTSTRGTSLDISGPLSILRHTTKYGLALARFIPAVIATPGFRLEARCVLGGEPVIVDVAASDRLARTHALPRDADSAIERALARDLRRLGCGFDLVREGHAIAHGGRVFFPDFALRRGEDLVLVEIVGFYTPGYLKSKLEALHAAAQRHALVVCLDASLDCGDDVPGEVLSFRRRVDATALVAAAERALSRVHVPTGAGRPTPRGRDVDRV
jgi:hypothetical protein